MPTAEAPRRIARMARKKSPTISDVARMGGQARAESLSPARRRSIAKAAGQAAAAAKAACTHEKTERRYSMKTGKPLPGEYCAACRRKLV